MMLTIAKIKNAKPKDRPYKLGDGRGMFMLVNPNDSRWWRYKYRFGGMEKLLALGTYPDVSLKEARNRLDEARKLLAEGKDPSAVRKAEKQANKLSVGNSFEMVAREFIEKQANRWSKTYAQGFRRRLELNVFPVLGNRPIGEIDAPELLGVLRIVEERGAYDLSHRLLQMCGQVFRYGVATGRCKRDPSSDLRGALTPHKKLHMAAVKPEEFPELLAKIDAYDGEAQTRLALQLLALTFVRTNELIGAEWHEFDIENAIWIVPEGRMKMTTEHIVPLSSQVLKLLEDLQALNGDSRYVFTGRNPHRYMSNNTMLYALYRMGYKSRMTGHGFRSVASTILNEESHFRPDAIERQLAHCERNSVRGAYNRAEYLEERRELMQWWADHIDHLRGGNVIPASFGKSV